MNAKLQLQESGRAKGEENRALEGPGREEFKLAKLLVPVDFSECSKNALANAVSFARRFKAELLLLHVVEPYAPYPEMTAWDAASFEAGSREFAQQELQILRQNIQPKIPCSIILKIGKASREIVEVAKESGVDLIIISTHGYTGLSRALLGSTTEQLVRQAGCPELVVRENEHDFVRIKTATFNSIEKPRETL
jgi:nucleotide-binding universal stress UspA family protein